MNTRGVSAPEDELALPEEQSAGDSVQAAFQSMSDTCYLVADEIARRSDGALPGLHTAFTERVLLVLGGQALGALGSYQSGKWQVDAQQFDEIHVNVGYYSYANLESRRRAEDIVVTIAHELAHLYARVNNIRDTSGRGHRYHNLEFQKLALELGLQTERSPHSYIGFTTPRLSAHGIHDFADLVDAVEAAVRLLPAPDLVRHVAAPQHTLVALPALPEKGRYVFATCGCLDQKGKRRTLRMARGWWQPGTVGCGMCKQLFTESPPRRTNT